MSVFKRIFSSEGKETVAFPWIPLEDPGQLDELILASKNRPSSFLSILPPVALVP